MDDGAKTTSMAVEMLRLLREQGIGRVVATPHYRAHEESPASFLARRQAAYERLQQSDPGMPVLLGAEIAVEQGLSEVEGLERLTLDGSRYMLLELPYSALRSWSPDEIHNTACTFGVTPVLAHVDRYLNWYSKEDMARVLHIPGAIPQINCEALLHRKTLKFVLTLLREGFPLVFGTDAHNMEDRAPNADLLFRILPKKLSPREWDMLLQRSANLL